jgi:hypothetical protein
MKLSNISHADVAALLEFARIGPTYDVRLSDGTTKTFKTPKLTPIERKAWTGVNRLHLKPSALRQFVGAGESSVDRAFYRAADKADSLRILGRQASQLKPK